MLGALRGFNLMDIFFYPKYFIVVLLLFVQKKCIHSCMGKFNLKCQNLE